MAEYLIQDTTLDDIADAINAKTGGSSAMTPAQMVTAIGNIPSGTTITDGIVIKARDASGCATEIDFYKGDGIINAYQFSYDGTGPWRNLTTINIIPNTIVLSGGGIFRSSKITQESASALFSKVTEIIGNGVGVFYGLSVTEAVLPNCTRILSNQLFRGCTMLQVLRLPVCATVRTGTNEDAIVTNLANLVELTVGSVGHPYMYTGNGHFLYGTNNANLVATFYVESGRNADYVLAMERSKSTTATIIIKAANALEYNGTSYAAGDTILTSEVTS